MERARSLSIEDREEKLTETHLIPIITERVVQHLMSKLINDYLKESIRESKTRKSHHRSQQNKSIQKTKPIKENRTASTKALYIQKNASVPSKKVSVTQIEKTPLAAQLALEKQMESKEYLFSTGTAAKEEVMSKCPSKSPSKRGNDKYDSRNQMIMVAGPTGK